MGTPDLNLLPLFVAVAETRTMSAAAHKLGIPKSSVSRGVASLEDALGVQLFHRSTRKLALTTAGSAFYEKVRPVVAALRDITGSLPEQETEPSGELRITAPIDMGLTFLAPLAAEFSARYPAIHLDIRPTNRTVDLVGEGFDLALRVAEKLSDSTLVARKLSRLELGLYASPAYLTRRGLPRTPQDTAEHDWVVFRGGRPLAPALAVPPKPRLVSDDLLFVHRAIRQGLGLGMIPTFVAREDVSAGLLVRVLPSFALDAAGSLFFVYPRTEHVPRKVAAFRDFLLAYLKANPLQTSGD
ncbi:MAG: LysR substrate-binding domain-containing protein [Cystobacter sp.]